MYYEWIHIERIQSTPSVIDELSEMITEYFE